MQRASAVACIAILVLTSCGGDGEPDTDVGTSGTTSADSGSGNTEGIDVCSLLNDAEFTAALGRVPTSSLPTEPIAGLTGCSWGVGLVIVQIRNSQTLITAPLEEDCPSANIGVQSTVCFGSVKFLTSNNIHATVSTIERLDLSQLEAIARTLLPKLQG